MQLTKEEKKKVRVFVKEERVHEATLERFRGTQIRGLVTLVS